MNTVERVARAILPFMSTSDAYRSFHRKAAKAALNALADGLEWRGEHAYYNGAFVGGVVKQLYGKWGWWGIWSKPINGPLHTEKEAREALMTAARKWLIGD